ncbi:MAG: class I adenylate-forming enzyme family protein [Mycobacterium sp.]
MSTSPPDLLDLLMPARSDAGNALVDGEMVISHHQLSAVVQARAVALAAHGVGPGDCVVVIAPNCSATIELYLACLLIGAVWSGVNPAAPAAERERQCGIVGPALVVTADPAAAPHGLRCIDLAALTAEGLDAHWEHPRPPLDAPCAIAFTSGTTAAPKIVRHNRSAVSLAAAAYARRLTPSDRVGIALPLSIHNVMVVAGVATLVAGATAVVLDRLNASGVADACRQLRLTLVNAVVPTTIHDLVCDDAIAAGSLSSLRYAGTGAAGLSEDLRASFEAKFGVRLCSSYGMTEAPGPVCAEDPAQLHRSGSSGVALEHVSIWASDDSGRRLPDGESGELCVGPAPTGRWAGLFNQTLRTGDIGRVEADGSVHVVGRRGNVIVRGGVNVNAGELEALLIAIPDVRDIAVVGEPDGRLGERIIAFVEVNAETSPEPEALRRQARALVAHGRVPDEFVIVAALPRNAMGKIERPRLLRPSSSPPK